MPLSLGGSRAAAAERDGRAQDERTLDAKRAALERLQSGFEQCEADCKAKTGAHEAAQKHYRQVQQGLLTTDEGEAKSLRDRLIGQLRPPFGRRRRRRRALAAKRRGSLPPHAACGQSSWVAKMSAFYP